MNLPNNFDLDYYKNEYNLNDMNKEELKKHYLSFGRFNGYKYNEKVKFSIVMSYFNRKIQIIRTLDKIKETYYNKYDFEVIIIDDNSNEDQILTEILSNYPYYINYIYISKEEKGDRINPCNAYNKGFDASTGEIVIIQNPECYHVGDILKYINDNMKENDYYSFSCYNTNGEEFTKELIESSNIIAKIHDPDFNRRNLQGFATWFNHPTLNQQDFIFVLQFLKVN